MDYPGPHRWNSFDEDDGTKSKDEGGSVKNPEAPIGGTLYLVGYQDTQVHQTVAQGDEDRHQDHQHPCFITHGQVFSMQRFQIWN